MNTVILVVECILEYQGRYLVIERPQGVHAGGLLAFPGGKVEESDFEVNTSALEKALKREVFEEVGIRLNTQPSYVMDHFFLDAKGRPVLDMIFYHRFTEGLPEIIPSQREVASYSWMTYDALKTSPLCPSWVLLYLDQAKYLYP